MRIKKLNQNARMPIRATLGSTGLDLYSCESLMLWFGDTGFISTGIALAFDPGVYGILCLRSSMCKEGVIMPTGVGIIDNDYRDEILIPVTCNKKPGITIKAGVRVAQIVLSRVIIPEKINLVDEFYDSCDRLGGFGSTGSS